MRKLLHIIDGSGYIYRAYYGIRPLSNAAGEPTNAVYGFVTMIERILREDQPDLIAIAFDAARENFRHEIYPEYKANRPPPPEDLLPQIPRIHQAAKAFRLPYYNILGCEADDVIATLTRRALASDFDVRIITGDKDLMQLVGEHVTLFEPMRNKRFTPKEVEEKLGIPPLQVADALALAGDSSDNIPGVRGVGPKTAAKYLEAYGDLEGVLKAAEAGEIKGKTGQTVAESVEIARLSRKLVQLDDQIELNLEKIDDLKYEGPDKNALLELYTELEFKRLIPKLKGGGGEIPDALVKARRSVSAGVTLSSDDYRTVTTKEALAELAVELAGASAFAFAVETASNHMVDTDVFGVAFAAEQGKAAYIPISHHLEADREASASLFPGITAQLTMEEVVTALKATLEDRTIKKISTESKSGIGLFLRYGAALRGLAFDTAIASYLLEPDEVNHNYEAVSRRFLGHEPMDRAEVIGKEKKKRPFDQVPIELATKFVGQRVDIALAAQQVMSEALAEGEVQHVFKDVELPLVPVIAKMELAGVKIDVEQLEQMGLVFQERLKLAEAACYKAAGKEFNIGSPKQLQKILFDELELKIIKRTKTGPSTDQSVLEALADAHPLPEKILEYRQVQKLKSTYVDALPRMVSSVTGRVHTLLNQTTAATGRLSSTDPNLQNIPVRTDLGRQLRKVFIADPGNVLVSVDYSQVELRVMAHFSKDQVLGTAFREGADVHTRTASVLMEVEPSAVTREQRNQAKAVNFGVLYGMGQMRLARDLKIPRRTAGQFIKDYHARQPGVRQFIDETLDAARETGMVRTILGRRRLLDAINSDNRGLRAAAERVATNTPIQGSAADLMKLAMIRVSFVLREQFPDAKLLLQVHDELLLETPKDQAKDVAQMVKKEMEKVFQLEVPLVAEAYIGANWDDAH